MGDVFLCPLDKTTWTEAQSFMHDMLQPRLQQEDAFCKQPQNADDADCSAEKSEYRQQLGQKAATVQAGLGQSGLSMAAFDAFHDLAIDHKVVILQNADRGKVTHEQAEREAAKTIRAFEAVGEQFEQCALAEQLLATASPCKLSEATFKELKFHLGVDWEANDSLNGVCKQKPESFPRAVCSPRVLRAREENKVEADSLKRALDSEARTNPEAFMRKLLRHAEREVQQAQQRGNSLISKEKLGLEANEAVAQSANAALAICAAASKPVTQKEPPAHRGQKQ